MPTFEIERKFLLAAAPDLSCALLRDAPVFHIEQTYLASADENVERRVRRREHAGHVTFFYTEKRPTEHAAVRDEHETVIDAAEYQRLAADADPACVPVVKQRRVFRYGPHTFELDSYDGRDLHVLEVELPAADVAVELPAEIEVAREVTGETAFKNRTLARRP